MSAQAAEKGTTRWLVSTGKLFASYVVIDTTVLLLNN